MVPKRQYKAIRSILTNRSFKVRVTNTLIEIHNEFGVGDIYGKELHLSIQDHNKLREFLLSESGADPLNDEITGDRLATAEKVRNEKWATKSVFSGMVQVSSATGMVPGTHGDAITPPGTILKIDAEYLDTSRITSVVLVENGAIARYWNRVSLPDGITDPLMLYRGHGEESAAGSKWISGLPDNILKVGFFDFDPAGIGMSLDYGLDAVIIPATLSEELIAGKNNKPEDYDKQMARRRDLGLSIPDSLREAWDWMTDGTRKCAVTQEIMMVNSVPLAIVYL